MAMNGSVVIDPDGDGLVVVAGDTLDVADNKALVVVPKAVIGVEVAVAARHLPPSNHLIRIGFARHHLGMTRQDTAKHGKTNQATQSSPFGTKDFR
jgi:hypothetical protein